MKAPMIIITLIIASGSLLSAQNRPGQKELQTKPQTPTERPDTLLAVDSMVKLLQVQQNNVRLQAQDAISQIQGQIDAYRSLAQDSVWVKKSVLGRQQ